MQMKAYLKDDGLLLEEPLPPVESDGHRLFLNFGCVNVTVSTGGAGSAVSESPVIKFKDILWAQPCKTGIHNELEISYVRKLGDRLVACTSVLTVYSLDSEPQKREGTEDTLCNNNSATKVSDESTIFLSEKVLERSYPESEPGRSIMVIINPHSGQGKANKIYETKVEPILKAAQCKITVARTAYSGNASDIAENMNIDKYDMILCASGDGIPHEVINGIYRREDRARAFDKLIITQTPSGSGNAMSLSCLGTLEPSHATLELLKAATVRNDLMAVCTQDADVKLSFLSQTYGLIAQADIGTEFMRWVGQERFLLGVCYQVLSKSKYPCRIAVKYIARTKTELSQYYKKHLNDLSDFSPLSEEDFKLKYADKFIGLEDAADLSLLPDWEPLDEGVCSNMGIFYSGKMPYISKDSNFFPAALPNDGSIDVVVTDVRSGISKTVDGLLSLDKGLHVWKDDVAHIKVEAFRVIPLPGPNDRNFISVDGENFKLRPFQVEILKGIMKTVMSGGCYTETGFVEQTKD